MDAIKKYLSEAVLSELEPNDRSDWLKTVKASVDAPMPVAPPRGLIGRVANVFI